MQLLDEIQTLQDELAETNFRLESLNGIPEQFAFKIIVKMKETF